VDYRCRGKPGSREKWKRYILEVMHECVLAPSRRMDDMSVRRLRCVDSHVLTVLRYDMERHGRRSFSVMAAHLWNDNMPLNGMLRWT